MIYHILRSTTDSTINSWATSCTSTGYRYTNFINIYYITNPYKESFSPIEGSLINHDGLLCFSTLGYYVFPQCVIMFFHSWLLCFSTVCYYVFPQLVIMFFHSGLLCFSTVGYYVFPQWVIMFFHGGLLLYFFETYFLYIFESNTS